LGLDHFEGRSWRGWQHHVTLVMLAYVQTDSTSLMFFRQQIV